MEIKFFPKDIVSGKADAIGDKFVAFFLTGNCEFQVTELGSGFFMAVAV